MTHMCPGASPCAECKPEQYAASIGAWDGIVNLDALVDAIEAKPRVDLSVYGSLPRNVVGPEKGFGDADNRSGYDPGTGS